MLRAILFDLDDTLYEERQFFHSGFVAVAGWLESRGVSPAERSVELLETFHHRDGREQVLQKLCLTLGFPAEWIPEMVDVFRSHRPDIRLADDARDVLSRMRGTHRLGCVTDGWASVQRAKVDALGVERLLDALVVTDDYGRERWKPHPFPFHRCCALLGVAPAESLYVGDNPHRDMIGAHNAGLRFIRLRRPGSYFEKVECPLPGAEEALEVNSLSDLEVRLREIQPRAK